MKNKINVNISPNPLDLQTLHCSQNDTGERKFYFTLHNNGEVIDTTDISDPIFEPFDVYKGGTEQLLPVNTDDPTTSPIIADIQYPDEEKTEQEFTYRESPTTIDGKALIEKIKGNTIVWNQLVQNGNFASADNWLAVGTTISVSNNVLTAVPYADGGRRGIRQAINFVPNHTYYLSFDIKVNKDGTASFRLYNSTNNIYTSHIGETSVTANTKTRVSAVYTTTNEYEYLYFYPVAQNAPLTTDTYEYSNCVCFDLTLMFGSTKADEIYAMEQSQSGSGVNYFRSLFPLPYYQYDAGSLLSFNGTGIKTVGKNLVDLSSFADEYVTYENGVLTGTTNRLAGKVVPIPFGKQATIQAKAYTDGNTSTTGWGLYIGFHYSDGTAERARWSNDSSSYTYNTITSNPNKTPVELYFGFGAVGNNIWHIKELQLEFGDTATSYEPYQSSTLDIPTSTYFPTGMKSAGSVFDELTNSKATKRIGTLVIDGSSVTSVSTASTGVAYARANTPSDAISGSLNIKSVPYLPINTAPASSGYIRFMGADMYIFDNAFTDLATAQSILNANPVTVYYESSTEQVTEFTHASLICEDGESTLYQDDDSLVCECTEDFSKDSGFKDCKIKFSKGDGVVYSNKIQLHIERKP